MTPKSFVNLGAVALLSALLAIVAFATNNQWTTGRAGGEKLMPGLGDTIPVATLPGCEGGYAGIFDMVGNVSEWIDDCDDTGCAHRGGSFGSGTTPDAAAELDEVECLASGHIGRLSKYGSVGIRCCSD